MKAMVVLTTCAIAIHASSDLPEFNSSYLQNAGSSFLFGGATSAAQVESNRTNHQWHRWIEECNASTDPKNHKMVAGNNIEFQKNYKEDIKRAHDIGLTALRFSIEWSAVQPTRDGGWNQSELDYYENICKTCKKYNITPFITLYHYSEPQWFWDLGSFEKAENIKYFVKFCKKVCKQLQKYEPMWLTFNTASGIMGKRYFKGNRPKRDSETPKYKKGSDCIKSRDFKLAGKVLWNVLSAHVAVYKAIKQIDNDAHVGFLKNIQIHEPYNAWNPLDQLGAWYANYMTDGSIITFLRTGTFRWIAPGIVLNEYNADAPHSFDFIGLNYYTRDFIKMFKPTQKPSDTKMQSDDRVIYPEGMYRALLQLHNDLVVPVEKETGKHIPIYVTETGIASRDIKDRLTFFKGYLQAVHKAMQDGVDVRGFIVWALTDCWSWGKWYDKFQGSSGSGYGLFHIDRKTQKRTLKDDAGTKYYLNVIAHNKPKNK